MLMEKIFISKKDMTFDNIKSLKNPVLHAIFRILFN